MWLGVASPRNGVTARKADDVPCSVRGDQSTSSMWTLRSRTGDGRHS
jgi:hypothetical protein